jgi:hypothetical protein
VEAPPEAVQYCSQQEHGISVQAVSNVQGPPACREPPRRPRTFRYTYQDVGYICYLLVRWRRLTMRSFAVATIMAAVYGYEVVPTNDPFVTKIEHLVSLFTTALTPERAALLLAFPFCMSNRLWCCVVALIVDVVSGPYSILAAGRRIQAKSCGMSCARRGSVNQHS